MPPHDPRVSQLRDAIEASISVKRQIQQSDSLLEQLLVVADRINRAFRSGGSVYLFGNGGSAADAQHIAAELVGRFYKERQPLPAKALTVNTSAITAIGNDYGFDQVFARQLLAELKPVDVVIGISTSGRSANVLIALRAARELGAFTVGLAGAYGDDMRACADQCLCVPSLDTPRIQESHILIGHLLCEVVEQQALDSGAEHP